MPKTWRAQHENGNILEISPRDWRGVELLRDCGYPWLNTGDDYGWRPTIFVLSAMMHRELAGTGANGRPD